MCTLQQSPGKFEGETCITYLANEWSGNGMADETQDDNGTLVDLFNGPFSPGSWQTGALCLECHNAILKATTITYWEDDQGFAYSETLFLSQGE